MTVSDRHGRVPAGYSIIDASTPLASLGPPTSATFIAGVPNSVVLTSSGAITPVSWVSEQSSFPSWLSLTDNGNGTATLQGMPPTGTTGMFSPLLGPYAFGSSSIGPPAPSAYPLQVVSPPV